MDTNKTITDRITCALRRKALGYSVKETVEEYAADGGGELKLTKKRISSHHFPPDLSAARAVTEGVKTLSEWTDEELEEERLRLEQAVKGAVD